MTVPQALRGSLVIPLVAPAAGQLAIVLSTWDGATLDVFIFETGERRTLGHGEWQHMEQHPGYPWQDDGNPNDGG
jgi:hypothetical protein